MSSGFGLPVLNIAGMIGGIGDAYTSAYDAARKKTLLSQLGSQLKSGDYSGAAAAALDAGELRPGVELLKLGAERDKETRQLATSAAVFGPNGLGGLYGGGQSPFGSGARSDAASGLPSFADQSGSDGGYLASLIRRESGGNPMARAATSSAAGLGQITSGTWAGIRKAHPELSLSPDGRFDPDQNIAATKALTGDNEGLLQRSGLPVNDATRYALHFMGASQGRRFVAGTLADPNRPATSLASPEQVAANRNVFFNRDGSVKSAGDVMNDFARSFGGGGSRVASRGAPSVDVAENEADVQRLERGMGMLPQQMAGADPQSDMPVEGGFTAALPSGASGLNPGSRSGVAPLSSSGRPLPSSDPNAINLPPGMSGTGKLTPRPSPALDVPTLGGPAGPGRAMTDPTVPVRVAQAGVGGAAASDPEAAEFQRRMGGLSSGERIGILLRAGGMDLPEHHRGLVKTLLENELQQARMPDDVKQYMVARSQGFGGSLIDFRNELRKPLTPTTVAPGNAVIAPGERSPFYVAPAKPERDEGDKLRAQVEARRDLALSLGLQEGSPSWRSFVATGKVGADRDMSAFDKKAIDTADTAAIASQTVIGQLEQAKEISAKAYAGPFAGYRGQFTGAFGSEAGQATTELDNVVTGSALAQLKTIFGGNPTEGERKILLEVQGSSSLPHPLRVKIYDRATTMARLKLEQNQAKADALREGRYFRQGGGDAVRDAGSAGDTRALPPPSPSNRRGASSAGDRFRQLRGQGLSQEEAFRRMTGEGY